MCCREDFPIVGQLRSAGYHIQADELQDVLEDVLPEEIPSYIQKQADVLDLLKRDLGVPPKIAQDMRDHIFDLLNQGMFDHQKVRTALSRETDAKAMQLPRLRSVWPDILRICLRPAE